MAAPIIRHETKQVQGYTEDLGSSVSLDMVLIPGGSFLMGSPEDEPGRNDNEGPQHQVTVSTFFMGQYPITQSQWRAVTALPKISQTLDPDPSQFKGRNRPVEQVNWFDAVEFCDRLSRKVGRRYRLPSEAEWEYACRAGTTTPVHFGEEITTEVANYDGRYMRYDGSQKYDGSWLFGWGLTDEYREETTPVDYFKVTNAFGLTDMHGNVREWCLDHWHTTHDSEQTRANARLTRDSSASRLIKGGSWDDKPWTCRSAHRNGFSPGSMVNYIGFRVVCEVSRR